MLSRLQTVIFALIATSLGVRAFVAPAATLTRSPIVARAPWAVRRTGRIEAAPWSSQGPRMATAVPDVVIAKPSIGFAPEKQSASSPNPEDKFKVMLFDDNGNTREYVSRSLVQVVGLPEDIAYQIMMQANNNGMAVVGVWHHEMADAYSSALKERGIVSEVFPADSS